MNPFSLEGKRVLITGATSGIGRATALQCAAMGADVVLMGRNVRAMEDVVGAIGKDSTQSFLFDLRDKEALNALMLQLPKFDGVVCNAGMVKSIVAKNCIAEDVHELFEVNTLSAIHLIQQILEQKRLNKGASVVMMSSMSGVYCGLPGGSAYGASKAALAGYAKALALELAPRGIRVNTVHPGMIATDLCKDTALTNEQFMADVANYPLGRYGTPEEVANAVVYLLSDATRWMTGTQLLIDGGYSVK